MTICLGDETSRLFFLEIISCGRNAHDERFQYRRLSSKVLLYRGDKLIYRDNTRYEPDKMPMEGIGMYEGYTHMVNLFLSKICSRDDENYSQESRSVKPADSAINLEFQEKIWQILFFGVPGGTRFLRVKVPNPSSSGKDIAEGKGVHREVESEGIRNDSRKIPYKMAPIVYGRKISGKKL